jgi:hypothetical protein
MVDPTGKSSTHDPLEELTEICSIIEGNQGISRILSNINPDE